MPHLYISIIKESVFTFFIVHNISPIIYELLLLNGNPSKLIKTLHELTLDY